MVEHRALPKPSGPAALPRASNVCSNQVKGQDLSQWDRCANGNKLRGRQ